MRFMAYSLRRNRPYIEFSGAFPLENTDINERNRKLHFRGRLSTNYDNMKYDFYSITNQPLLRVGGSAYAVLFPTKEPFHHHLSRPYYNHRGHCERTIQDRKCCL